MAKQCDIVMEGGGVKGIALVGALTELEKAGYTFSRIGGTSAGAITGALLAAGMRPTRMKQILDTLDYKKFRDEGTLDRLGLVGKGLSFVFEKGLYEGTYFKRWLTEQLESLGVRTFADLKLKEPWAKDLPPEQRYKLVVITADISRGRLVRLPWDYHLYGLDPDTQPVVDAVRASMSIPFFYEPVRIGDSYFVDGATLSNFPINIFDSANDWPTFGIKLSARPEANTIANPISNTYNFSLALLDTILSAHDAMHLDDPCTIKRTIFIDSESVKATNFDISRAEQDKLFKNGVNASKKFLAGWDYAGYKKVRPAKVQD